MQLKEYFLHTVKIEYQKKLKLFVHMTEENPIVASLHTLEEFVGRFHEKEVIDGQIREILHDIVYCIDEHSTKNSPIVYKIVLGNSITSHRTGRPRITPDCIVHCRCGSVYDENSLVQCYACQVRSSNLCFIHHSSSFSSYGNMSLVFPSLIQSTILLLRMSTNLRTKSSRLSEKSCSHCCNSLTLTNL